MVESIECVLSVLQLGPEPMSVNYQDPVTGQSFPGNPYEAVSNMFRQADGVAHVKTKLDCRGNFIDILTSRPGGMDKMEFYFFFVKVQRMFIHRKSYDTSPRCNVP